MPKVSIIVPVYNVEEYLAECVESILSQSYSDYEMILVDDGSTDSSGTICDSYSGHGKIKVIHKENGGLSSARNAGMRAACGELLCFVDSDDCVSKTGLEELIRIYDESGADVVIAGYSSNKADLEYTKVPSVSALEPNQALKLMLKERINPSAWAKLYKASLFENISFPDGLIYEDYATFPKILGVSGSVAVTDIPIYYYRPNPQSITGVAFSEKRMQFFTVADTVLEYLRGNAPELIKWAEMRHTRYAISFYMQIARSGFKNDEIENYLVKLIRKNILKYCFITRYSPLSRAYGLLIALSPRAARHFGGK